MTDFLRYLFSTFSLYKPVVPLLNDMAARTRSTSIIDIASGGGGPILDLKEGITNVSFTLTDKYPNIDAYSQLQRSHDVNFCSESVDAMNVPAELKGIRTYFSCFHHFNPESAVMLLKDAVQKDQPVAVFDGGNKNVLMCIAIIIFQPVLFLLMTPFIKPFNVSRIVFTYFVPIIPFCTIWDGVISIIRLYTPDEMLQIARSAGPGYNWSAGKLKGKWGVKISYLLGEPK